MDNSMDSFEEINYLLKLEKEFEELGTKEKKALLNLNLSNEQKNIINSSNNLTINAVAGSGKSTVILHFALKYPEKNMIQITYNNMLKHEIRNKIKLLEINNLLVHTYHSLAVNFYDKNAYTDEEIKKILLNNVICKNSNKYDVILIDETQDMMSDYYLLIKKFIKDTKSDPQILIFGDIYQGIYEFKGSSYKFLTLANQIWKKQFEQMTLSTSFRMTNQTAWFVNNCMLGYNRINCVKDGPKVDYYICNPYKIYETIGKSIIQMIKNENIKEEDIFVLSPSVKAENPYKKLENFLVANGYKCMTPISDEAKLDDKIISNKIVFTTYHQSKGRERKVVILYSFDSSYFDYYLKGENKLTCPNILYVGATRVMHKLILIHDARYSQFEFLNLSVPNINKYVNIINTETIKLSQKPKDTIDHKTNVTDLIKFIDSYILDTIILLIDSLFITIKPIHNIVNVPCKIMNLDNNKESYEDVSDLNGLVIPAIYEKLINNLSTIEDFVSKNINKKNPNNDIIKKYIKKINIPCKKISDYLKVGNIYISLHNKLHSKLAQIKKYNWLDKKMIMECHKNMKILENKNLTFEKNISNCDEDTFKIIHKEHGKIVIGGRIDAFDDKNVYEFKCVDNISIDHKLQLILYYWLWKNSDLYKMYGNRDFKLLNIRTGELLQLVSDNYKIIQIIELIFANKFIKKSNLEDDEFINHIHKIEKKFTWSHHE
jgi:hypothetical protein